MKNPLEALPQDRDTERALLAIILRHRGLAQASTPLSITADLFHLPEHRALFNAAVRIPPEVPLEIENAVEYLRASELFDFRAHPGLLDGYGVFLSDVEMTEFYVLRLAELQRQRELIILSKKVGEGKHTSEEADRLIDLLAHPDGEGREIRRPPRIRFYKPSELRDFEPPTGHIIAGDCQITRGAVFVIGGEPGVGKSTAATELAVCAAQGRDWFGIPIHGRYKTMIIQNENGRFRLRQEYQARHLGPEIEDYIMVSEPPPYGMTLNHPDFLADLRNALDSFRPDIVIFDPWNAVAKDDKAADYLAAFEALLHMLPTGDDKPALGIVAHTRKPHPAEKRTGGTNLMHLLAGSYVITSVPRGVFIMVRGSDDESDNSVVLFNPKNNDGPKVARSAWQMQPSGFVPLPDFDWVTFENGECGRKMITLDHIREALGNMQVLRSEAVKQLAVVADVTERACRDALSPGGKFGAHLNFFGDLVAVK